MIESLTIKDIIIFVCGIGGALVINTIKTSFFAGKKYTEFALTKDVETKITVLKDELNFKIDKLDDKFKTIDKNLTAINDILTRQETREQEREKYSKQIKEAEAKSLENITKMFMDFNKEQSKINDLVHQHTGFINNIKERGNE